ncbi:MAG: TonB-dependent receptor [Hyphomonas sp.]|nr:TonB-dependent receptor [Hyphomonas sp.]
MSSKKLLLLGSAALSLAHSGVSYAQGADGEADGDALVQDKVIVTGSNIAGASDSGAIAVSTYGRDEIEALGQNSTGEILQNLPQAGSFEINDAADGPNDARGDVATVNLRGLGTGNTLVLLNGRRITAHGINQDVGEVPRQITNVNAFPAAAINRVEVLRDGASALYGSDATAGVVNTILSADFDGSRLTVKRDWLEGTDSKELTIDFATGFEFNKGKTNLLVVGSFYDRDGLYASELGTQFQYVDKRLALGDSEYATANTDFRNTSTSSPFGQFIAGSVVDGVFVGSRVRQNGSNVTNSSGTFHIQPCDFNGTRYEIGVVAGEGCMGIDDGNLDTALRYDFNVNQPNNSLGEGVDIMVDPTAALGRQLISDAKRYNFYSLVEHDFDNGVEGFGEVLYYRSVTDSNRATQPLDSGLAFLIVPKENYWNPFGAVGSPNRIDGIDAPAEGLDILIGNWRPTDLGPRFISTESSTYRVLGGFRGDWNDWSWETALGYSKNETEDTESNRLSKTLLDAELSKSTPDAINPFGGPNANTEEQWNRVRISNTNVGTTSLTTWDLRFTKDDFMQTWAGDVGVSFGIDYRREAYEEDRDPRLDGTITYDLNNVSGVSDVVGVSPTRDSEASRDVYAMSAEALIPLVKGADSGFVNEWNLQLAARGEYFADIEDGAIKPKVALSWFPVNALNFRAAYSEGFRAPNLVQLYRGDISRLNLGNDDYWRSDVTGDSVSTGDAYLAEVRKANPDLENEDTKTYVLGLNANLADSLGISWLDDLRFSVDYWRFEQEGVIDTFGAQEALALDFLLRQQGSSNPNVVRASVTADDQAAFDAYNLANPTAMREAAGQVLFVVDNFINLDSQEADGVDVGMAMSIDGGKWGDFDVTIDTSRLMSLEVVRSELLSSLANDPAFAGEFDALSVDRVELNGNPKWRSTGTLRWRKGRLGAGAAVKYVSGFYDTSADPDLDGDGLPDFWRVSEALRVNSYVDYRLKDIGIDGMRIRFGVNNVFDEDPPLADESRGWYTEYHSVKGREYYIQLQANF